MTTPTKTALDKAEEALDSMPDFLGTPETSAHKRSLENVAKWYCRYYATIRQALTAIREARQQHEGGNKG